MNNTLQESVGGNVANDFNGGAGDDSIDAGGGNDTLEGGEGNDTLDGGAGNRDIAIYSSTKDDYKITVNADVASGDVAQLVVTYVGNGDDEGEDILSNIELIQFSDGTSVNATDVISGKFDDTDAPIFASASVNGNALVLSFSDDNLLSASTASANAFSITNGGLVNPVIAVSADIEAKTITLTLSNAVINGQAVTVSYNDPTGSNDDAAVQDASGNDAASFAAQTVNNLTAAVAVAPTSTPVVVLPSNAITALPADTRTYDMELPLTEDADQLDGSPGNEKFLGLGGNDKLDGKEGNDYLDGGVGDDTLIGGLGDDYLLGGLGNDNIDGGAGDSSIDGGDGSNTIRAVDYNSKKSSVFIISGAGNDNISAYGGSDGSGVASINGGAGNDQLYFYAFEKSNFDGGSGDDNLLFGNGQGRNNTLHGGDGNDSVSGNGEIDTSLFGDAGNDTISVSTKEKGYGGDGNDTLRGSGLLDGGAGNDILNNNGNTTTVFYGGADSDTIITNKVKAVIPYHTIDDSKLGAGNRDIVTDFDTSSGAVFELYHLLANPLTFLGSKAFDGTSGAVRFAVEPANKWTLIQVDINGDNTADMEIELTGLKFLSADDFVLSQPV